MQDNIIHDQATVVSQLTHSQDALDAFERLMKYLNALEAQNGYLQEFVDQQSDAITDAEMLYYEQLDALRESIADAEQGVEDNYGLMDDPVIDQGKAYEELEARDVYNRQQYLVGDDG